MGIPHLGLGHVYLQLNQARQYWLDHGAFSPGKDRVYLSSFAHNAGLISMSYPQWNKR